MPLPKPASDRRSKAGQTVRLQHANLIDVPADSNFKPVDAAALPPISVRQARG